MKEKDYSIILNNIIDLLHKQIKYLNVRLDNIIDTNELIFKNRTMISNITSMNINDIINVAFYIKKQLCIKLQTIQHNISYDNIQVHIKNIYDQISSNLDIELNSIIGCIDTDIIQDIRDPTYYINEMIDNITKLIKQVKYLKIQLISEIIINIGLSEE